MYNYTEEQVKVIKAIIEGMLNRARGKILALDGLCDPDYLKGRAQYPLSAIVYTGFDPDNQSVPGLTIRKIYYGKGRYMPELYNRDVVSGGKTIHVVGL